MRKTIKLNKYHNRILGVSIFFNADLIRPLIKSPETESITVEIESNEVGIAILPVRDEV